MSTHPVDRLIAHASICASHSRLAARNGDRARAREALQRAETLLQVAAHARLVEAVARFTVAASVPFPATHGAGQ